MIVHNSRIGNTTVKQEVYREFKANPAYTANSQLPSGNLKVFDFSQL